MTFGSVDHNYVRFSKKGPWDLEMGFSKLMFFQNKSTGTVQDVIPLVSWISGHHDECSIQNRGVRSVTVLQERQTLGFYLHHQRA